MCPTGSAFIVYTVKNTFIDSFAFCDREVELDTDTPRRRAHTACVANLHRDCSHLPLATGGGRGEMGTAEAILALRESFTRFKAEAQGALAQLRPSATTADGAAVASNVRGRVLELALSPNGRQALLEVLPSLCREAAAPLAGELGGHAWHCALNSSGSLVLSQLLHVWMDLPETQALAEELLAGDVSGLCAHKAGHEVARALLARGTARQRAVITAALRGDLQRFARHRFAALVLTEALTRGPDEEREALAEELLRAPGAAVRLACHEAGLGVVRALLQVPGAGARALLYLSRSANRISKDKFGMQLARELGWRAT